MTTVEFFPLDRIEPNPFQSRLSEDPEHIAAIADSIERDGLLQIPTGRLLNNNHVQLAFGMTRLNAFHLICDRTQGAKCAEMPVNLVELTDEQMFEYAITENLRRKNLSPVETAQAMKRYRDEFGKTSEQIGELFGLDAATVRGKLRLLDLPDPVRDQLHAGQISENAARSLLSAGRILGAEKLADVAQELTQGGYESVPKINDHISSSLHQEAKQMWGPWSGSKEDSKPHGGPHLWPLDWKHHGLPDLKVPSVMEMLKLDMNQGLHEIISTIIEHARAGMDVAAQPDLYMADGIQPRLLDQIQALINPKPCMECPLYVRLEGHHWCGLESCWRRKKKAYVEEQAIKLSEKTGIPLYDREKDGSEHLEFQWNNDEKTWQKRYDDRDPGLRLKKEFQEYNPHRFTDSYYCSLVDVDPKRLDQRQKKEKREEQSRLDREDSWEHMHKLQEASKKFLHEAAAPVFAQALVRLDNVGVLKDLARVTDHDQGWNKNASRHEKLQFLRCELVYRTLEWLVDYELESKGPIAVAEHLESLVTSWGVQLPADWLDQAKAFWPEGMKPPKEKPAIENPKEKTESQEDE